MQTNGLELAPGPYQITVMVGSRSRQLRLYMAELILGFPPANERRRYFVTTSLIGWVQADSRLAPSKWETALLRNDVSHWLGSSLESALYGTKTFSLLKAGSNIWILLLVLFLLLLLHVFHTQGLTYSTAQQPRASKTISQASGFGKSFISNDIESVLKKGNILEKEQVKLFGNVKPDTLELCRTITCRTITLICVLRKKYAICKFCNEKLLQVPFHFL